MSSKNKDNQNIIVALDYYRKKDAIEMAKRLDPSICNLKVGLELFISEGPRVISDLGNLGYKVFLDLKLHDIPNTVQNSCKMAAELGVWMLNVHASGGRKMLEAAKNVFEINNYSTKLIGVTILTSLTSNELDEVGQDKDINNQVTKLTDLCMSLNYDGVVCSPHESKNLYSKYGNNIILVCPGIRNEDITINYDDQKRYMSPVEAARNKATYIVVGRPITGSEDPSLSLEEINNQFNEGAENA
ncbi:MAG: orotidine-5'-phosphate decarboxylase [Gammaproteobacteria bacterium]|nr:orotidine-5'-phosphate decarboxylase [Gammaproteobacteria bacterium]|tara:strand:- start:336 stop:1067 length:732 start_codon:yes stop_codon:yes gene_type:complete